MTKTFCDACGLEEQFQAGQTGTDPHRFSAVATIPGCGHVMVSLVLCPQCAREIMEGLQKEQRMKFDMVPMDIETVHAASLRKVGP